MYRNFILPVSLLAGTIIGAGMFALPYSFEKAGIITGLLYVLLFGGVFTIIHPMYAEIGLRNKDHHRLVGHAEKYLGPLGRYITVITSVLGMLFALTIYLVLSLSFIHLMFPNAAEIYALLIFWCLGSLAIFLEVNNLALSEFIITVGMISIIMIITGVGLAQGEKIFELPLVNTASLLVPLGAVLFSLSGRVAIPAVVGYFRKNNLDPKGIRPAIITGTMLPALFYFLFVIGILGLSSNVSEDAIKGIEGSVNPILMWLLGALGIISLWSSYIVIGRDLSKSLEYDFAIPKIFKISIVVFFPLLLYYAGFQSFVALVALAGSIFVGMESILVVAMWRKAQKEPYTGPVMIRKSYSILQYGIMLVFICGVVYEIIK